MEPRRTGRRIAVVTGANKGIGFGICKQLASRGLEVILTARDVKRGARAAEKLKESGLSTVAFHQLDVTDSDTIASLANFIATQYGKLDILVNNAAIGGYTIDEDYLKSMGSGERMVSALWSSTQQTYELAEECMKINYYGAKEVAEALVPLMQLSNSPRIVNVSSLAGRLKVLSHEKATEQLGNVGSLTEDRIDEVVQWYLKDYRENKLEDQGWPRFTSAYILSKAALNAYTRILARKYPTFRVNSVHPGLVKTDLSKNLGGFSVEEGARGPVMLALLPDTGPSGAFFNQMEVTRF